MADSTRRWHGEGDARREAADLEAGAPEDHASPDATSADGTRDEANPEESKLWDITKKITLTATMGWVSAGYAQHNAAYRAIGFGHLAAYHAEKAAESWPDREAAAASTANALGTAVWAGGIGSGNKIAQTVGPAWNVAANLTSAAWKYSRGKPGWARELVDVSEMAAFTAAGVTQHPAARAVAFSSAGAGFFWDAVQSGDKGLLGHGAGALVWAAGAGMKNESWQAAGAGAVAFSEFARLAYPYLESLTQKSPSEAAPAPEQPGEELTVRQETTSTGAAVPATVADTTIAAAAHYLLSSGPATETTHGQDVPPGPIPAASSLSLPTSPVAPHEYAPTTRGRSHSESGGLPPTASAALNPTTVPLPPSSPATESTSSHHAPPSPIPAATSLPLPTSPVAPHHYAPPTTRTRSRSEPGGLPSVAGESAATPASTPRPQVPRRRSR